jgi:hypothetical protein
MMFGSVSEHFSKLQHVKRRKNLCFGPECTISGYQDCEASIILHWNRKMFESVSEHFANLLHIKRRKSCVSGLNALFWGTKVAKQLLYSIGTKRCLGVFQSISLTFCT